MKQLVKPEKNKKETFDSLQVSAFHENSGRYTRDGNHYDFGFYDCYSETSGVKGDDEVLF